MDVSIFLLISTLAHSCRLLTLGEQTSGTCVSPQYVRLGSTSTVKCSPYEDFYAVLWYDTMNYAVNEPIVHYQDMVKSGKGYNSGKFDIHPNGSLIIQNVSLDRDHTFKVAYVDTRTAEPVFRDIEVIVTVKPSVPFPVFDQCETYTDTCFSEVTMSTVQCSVRGARPSVSLTLASIATAGDRHVPSDLKIIPEGAGYTSCVSTTEEFPLSPLLLLLVCKASDHSGILKKNESLLLAQTGPVELSDRNATQTYVDRYTKTELKCTDSNWGFVVWKKLTIREDKIHHKLVLYSVFLGEQFTQMPEEESTSVYNDSLIIPFSDLTHEGRYYCIFGDGVRDDVKVHDVEIIVRPTPLYPVIDGCTGPQHCVVEVEHAGNLKCTVQGIRPQVQLDWKAYYDSDANSIHFSKKQTTIQNNGETFDITIMSRYTRRDNSRESVAVVCKVTSHVDVFVYLEAKVDLKFVEGSPPTNGSINVKLLLFCIIIATLVIFILLGIFLGLMKKLLPSSRLFQGTSNREHGQRKDFRGKDGESHPGNEQETVPMVKSTQLKDKKTSFISQLKEKYKDLYEGVRPVPFRNSKVCVNSVYVQGGIEVLKEVEGGRGSQWKQLKSYQDIFRDLKENSNRCIIQSEPGYGKTTLALKVVYDWCNHKTSIMRNVDILIFLQLGQFDDNETIYNATKRYLLPKDTQVSEKDIENILSESERVVLILDGFDEYPDQGHYQSVVREIMARKLLQHRDIILTTRSSAVLKEILEEIPPKTRKVRLTGFDHNHCRVYFGKEGKHSKEVQEKLERFRSENPKINELFRSPALFAITADMANETDRFEKFSSVTYVFCHIVASFHMHMKNKKSYYKSLPDQNKFEENHQSIDKLCFEAVKNEKKSFSWKKENLTEKLGKGFCEYYESLGILVEEVAVMSGDVSTCMNDKTISKVKFYHQLICEWYAAHYLRDYVKDKSLQQVKEYLDELDSGNFQYVYRFTCGLDPNAADKILAYLMRNGNQMKLATLCILEQTEHMETCKKNISKLGKHGIIISGHESLLHQTASVDLLRVAQQHDISIATVDLHNYMRPRKRSPDVISIHKTLMLNPKMTIVDLGITLTNRNMTGVEAVDILQFSSKCEKLELLRFERCVLPRVFKIEPFLQDLENNEVTVKWRCNGDEPWYILNLKTGRWGNKHNDVTLSKEKFRKMRTLKDEALREQLKPEKELQELQNTLRKKTDEKSQYMQDYEQ